MSSNVLHVVDDAGNTIATIDGPSHTRLTLRYADGYSGIPLSTSMPSEISEHPHTRIHPYLWGLLPDNDNVIERWARAGRVSASNVRGLLDYVGADVAGAFRYAYDPDALTDRTGINDVEPLDDTEIANRLRDLTNDQTRWHARNHRGRWSLAGAQPKIALARAPIGWADPTGDTASTHIFKPPISGFDNFEINEHLCLEIARRLGLATARSEVLTFEDQTVIAVERYDRTSDGERIHQEDMCQALGYPPSAKYQSDDGPTPAEIADRLYKVGIPEGQSVQRFAEALLYNWLVVGTDAHAKNYSMLITADGAVLAPLYDIASALPYPDIHIRKARLAMKFGSTYQPDKIGVRHIYDLAKSIHVNPDWLQNRAMEMAAQIGDAAAAAADASGLDEASHIAAAIADWAARCESALT